MVWYRINAHSLMSATTYLCTKLIGKDNCSVMLLQLCMSEAVRQTPGASAIVFLDLAQGLSISALVDNA